MPSSDHSQRTLAAIVVTDVVGFSARMSANEAATLTLVNRDLQRIADLCDTHEGQVLKTTGDGLLLYFASAVQAVACAVTIQAAFADLAEGLAPEHYLEHRIGIHLGDIFFNHADVMGNGVNIAARLQTYADPGGICLSQTVYDVVKASLQLEATYVGPLTLKNIQDPVPTYKIRAPRQESSAAEVAGVGRDDMTQLGPPQPGLLLESIVQTLSQHPQQLRIKKLIFGTCQHAWENDSTVLEQFELKELLRTLLQRYPTAQQFKHSLDYIVAGLNRVSLYTSVADIILEQVQPWYAHRTEHTLLEGHFSRSSTYDRYQAVASSCEQSSDPLRIKKLIYCICHNTWVNDPEFLQPLAMRDLIIDLHGIASTPKDLKYHLKRVIQRLNRKTEYTQLGNQVLQACRQLYQESTDTTQLPTPRVVATEQTQLAPEAAVSPENTQMVADPGTDTDAAWTTVSTCLSAENPELTTAHSSLSVQTAAEPTGQPKYNLASLVDLRAEIMKYTNPLRAKILLLSSLRGPFGFTQQDWLVLKSKTLDDLLQGMFNYCPSLADLESKLTIISRCLDNEDENAQVASALLQAMKPYYTSEESPTLTSTQMATPPASTAAPMTQLSPV
ncbi:adenylate/guanylate cyclase domain-containing protein [Halomicronema hongdechloris]|nr:adenylate/guanylate cyclase domain-containing protein [Halomicronema hongdechloris]